MSWRAITNDLVAELEGLRFGPPVTHVYNPLVYARGAWDRYCAKYGRGPKEFVFLGMNPGPYGMAQTGVPFGEVAAVRDWLGIRAKVGAPPHAHPKRPVLGFDCPRSEVSGRRLWGWAAETFDAPEAFFARFFVANYCPLVFMAETGRNVTPDKLARAEREPLFAACDRALRRTVALLEPEILVGVGKFAETRARGALADLPLRIGQVLHPSPASPRANRGWADQALRDLAALGIAV
jgi:single-strand selective monofunctional uracil DNA glycosylase